MAPLRIGIITGEASGDLLGASLMKALQKLHPDISFEGIAGPKMIAAGCHAVYPMERLAVMGVVEPLKRLPELLQMRRYIIKHFIQNPPDVFIGIDSPEFNLGVEEKLKKTGITTVHYVSPSVWAWRQGRIKKIKRAVDLMLTLLPFEADFYKKNNMPVEFVGHPLADQISLACDQFGARQQLRLPVNSKILAILPGSRAMEIKQLAAIFIQTAAWCLKHDANLKIITSMINEERRQQFETILKSFSPNVSIEIFVNQSREVMASADVLLLASGTVTLEAMLLKKPMVVAYRFSPFNYFIAKLFVKLKHFSLPNLLANKKLVPEFLQEQVVPEQLGLALIDQLHNEQHKKDLVNVFSVLHKKLKKDASHKAAVAIMSLIKKAG